MNVANSEDIDMPPSLKEVVKPRPKKIANPTAKLKPIAKSKPTIITVTGHPGIGKTTLAATFPKPIVIRFEDGLESIPEDKRPDAFPLVKSVEQVWEQLYLLIKNHSIKTHFFI